MKTPRLYSRMETARELLLTEAAHGERGQGRQPGHDPEEGPEAGDPGDRASEEKPGRRAERQPADEAAVFSVGIGFRAVLVIEAVDGDVEGAIGDADQKKDGGHGRDASDRSRGDEEAGQGQESPADHGLHRQPVVDPTRREREDDRGRGEEGDDRRRCRRRRIQASGIGAGPGRRRSSRSWSGRS